MAWLVAPFILLLVYIISVGPADLFSTLMLLALICGGLYLFHRLYRAGQVYFDRRHLIICKKERDILIPFGQIDVYKMTSIRINYFYVWELRWTNEHGQQHKTRFVPLPARQRLFVSLLKEYGH